MSLYRIAIVTNDMCVFGKSVQIVPCTGDELEVQLKGESKTTRGVVTSRLIEPSNRTIAGLGIPFDEGYAAVIYLRCPATVRGENIDFL